MKKKNCRLGVILNKKEDQRSQFICIKGLKIPALLGVKSPKPKVEIFGHRKSTRI